MSTATVSSPVWLPGAEAAYILDSYSGCPLLIPGDYLIIKYQSTAEDNDRVIIRCGDKLLPVLVKMDGCGNPIYYPIAGGPFYEGDVGSIEIVGKIQGILFEDQEEDATT